MFRGIITPIVTPFHRDDGQRINYEAAEELIEYVIANGVSGIFLLGSNGEFHVIDREEKIQFVREAVKIVNGRVPVFAGPGACSTQETVYLAKEMEAAGADALSVISPYFVQPTEEELYSHFRTVAESVKIPVILYNIPRLTGMNISAGLFDRLARQGCVAGIKDSSRSEENLRAYLEVAKRNNLAVLVGSDGMRRRHQRQQQERGKSAGISGGGKAEQSCRAGGIGRDDRQGIPYGRFRSHRRDEQRDSEAYVQPVPGAGRAPGAGCG